MNYLEIVPFHAFLIFASSIVTVEILLVVVGYVNGHG